MAVEKKNIKLPHNLILENRKSLTLTGVSDVDSFDEQTVTAYTDYGELVIKGKNLHINKLSLESGELTLEGEVSSLIYTENRSNNGSILSKLFR
ncbi:MAG: sporulation protein YabP [Acutalibacteraceae bacterium]